MRGTGKEKKKVPLRETPHAKTKGQQTNAPVTPNQQRTESVANAAYQFNSPHNASKLGNTGQIELKAFPH